jgi:hypothetical protein
VKAAIIGIRTLADYSVEHKDHQHQSWDEEHTQTRTRKVHQLEEVDILTTKIDLLMKKLENLSLDHLQMVDAWVTCEECRETGHMGINCPMIPQNANFIGNSNNGFVLIKASMLGGTNPVSRLTTTNRVVLSRISTEISPLSEISFEICRSGFITIPPVLLPEQPDVVLLLERALVSWSLAMDERSGHEDLHGSGRRSVIPYVHGRTELYCPCLPYLSLHICPPALTDLSIHPCEEAHARAFYSSRSGSYIETWGLAGGPEVVETLYNI